MDIGQTSDDMGERSDTRVDRGQVPGFWVALAGLIFALTFPLASFIVSVLGMGLSVRAYRASAAGRGRWLAGAGTMLATAAILVVVVRDLSSFWLR